MLSATNTGTTIEILQPNGVLYDGTRIYYDTRWLSCNPHQSNGGKCNKRWKSAIHRGLTFGARLLQANLYF